MMLLSLCLFASSLLLLAVYAPSDMNNEMSSSFYHELDTQPIQQSIQDYIVRLRLVSSFSNRKIPFGSLKLLDPLSYEEGPSKIYLGLGERVDVKDTPKTAHHLCVKTSYVAVATFSKAEKGYTLKQRHGFKDHELYSDIRDGELIVTVIPDDPLAALPDLTTLFRDYQGNDFLGYLHENYGDSPVTVIVQRVAKIPDNANFPTWAPQDMHVLFKFPSAITNTPGVSKYRHPTYLEMLMEGTEGTPLVRIDIASPWAAIELAHGGAALIIRRYSSVYKKLSLVESEPGQVEYTIVQPGDIVIGIVPTNGILDEAILSKILILVSSPWIDLEKDMSPLEQEYQGLSFLAGRIIHENN